MSGERLELVTSFSSLKAGDYVELRPCYECGGTHRMILVRYMQPSPARDIEGVWQTMDAWLYEPAAPCDREWAGGIPCGITPMTVERGAVFKVDAGLEASDSTRTRQRKPKTVRA